VEVTPNEEQDLRPRSRFFASVVNIVGSLGERCAKQKKAEAPENEEAAAKEETPKKKDSPEKEENSKNEGETARKIIEIDKRRENKETAKKAEIGGRNEGDAMTPRKATSDLREDLRQWREDAKQQREDIWRQREGVRRRGEAIRELKEDISKTEEANKEGE
jgi:hypothetical protein